MAQEKRVTAKGVILLIVWFVIIIFTVYILLALTNTITRFKLL